MMAQTQVVGNQCTCLTVTCDKNSSGPCSDDKCTTCRSCCSPNCKRCNEKCKPGMNCECNYVRCGCEKDCNKSDGGGKCKGLGSNCKRCQQRCKPECPCICYFCTCGTKCNGVICSCCSWCDPKNCSGKECNGFVIGRCSDKGLKECIGHVKYDIYDKNDEKGTYGAVLDRTAKNVITCDGRPHPGEACTDDNCNWLGGERDMNGNCVIKCTYCGKLCGQDKFRRCCYIAVPLVITVSAFLIFRFMSPEKFQSMMTKIRAAFPSSPRNPGRSLSNLVGDRIPKEINVDRYPAFRPRTYAGLA